MPTRATAPATPDAKAGPAAVTIGVRAPAPPTAANLHRQYGEVLDDLRLTAIIFVALIAVMVVLSFVVR